MLLGQGDNNMLVGRTARVTVTHVGNVPPNLIKGVPQLSIFLILAGLADQLSNQLNKSIMKFSIALISLISFATIAAATDAVYADHPAARDFNDEFGVVRRDSEGALYRVRSVLNDTPIVRLTIVIYVAPQSRHLPSHWHLPCRSHTMQL